MGREEVLELLLDERRRLLGQLEQGREQLERMGAIVDRLAQRVADDERMLTEIESVLGKNPQLRLDDADLRLRGRRLEEVAIRILQEERGAEQVHYREWFELLRARGHLVAGKQPLDTFLSQISRSGAVERVGRRSGLYRLARAV
jgi:hypothetical protein